MDRETMNRIFAETAWVRMGGTDEELRAAEYLQEACRSFGGEAVLEPFLVDMGRVQVEKLWVDGVEVPCRGYMCAGSSTVEGELYYLRDFEPCSLDRIRGKIVLLDGYLGYWKYQDILEHGAIGFITYDGNANYTDRDMDKRELRSFVSQGRKLPGVNINAKDAIALVRDRGSHAKIQLEQEEYGGESRNVVLELPGQVPEYIVLTAHYDSTSLSQGAYDNMSGCVGLLAMAERFSKEPHRYGLRFIWCGSEERGLLGSKAYCREHEEELKKIVLNVNLDMIGCIMGNFIACCTSEEKLVHYIEYFAGEQGFGCKSYQDVYSSDSTPFADRGIPAVSFARAAPANTATIHNSYDTMALMSMGQMEADIRFISDFVARMANAIHCPVARKMPENMKEKLDEYLARKRKNG